MIFKIENNDLGFINLKNEWSQLLSCSFSPSITQSWEWMHTWWDIYGKERDLLIFLGYQNGNLVGIAPLSVIRKRIPYYKIFKYKTVWFLGSGQTRARGVISDYLDLIVKQGDEEQFIDGLLQYMSKYQDWDEIILENISTEAASAWLLEKFSKKYRLKFKIIDRTPSILIKLPDSWDEYFRSISSSTRYKIKRGRKEFKKLGGTYRRINAENELQQAFTDLEKLHQHRWDSKGIAGAFSSREWKSFHKKLMPLLLRKKQLRLSFLYLNNKPVAANYNFAFNEKIYSYQSGMIPHENKHIRLGFILHSYCIEESIKEGFREYDFLKIGASGAGYKSMWANNLRDLLTLRISRNSKKDKIFNILNESLNKTKSIKHKILKGNTINDIQYRNLKTQK
ncbi:MAG: GNAT family N-acetyltransferase [Spirochaetes bacterium]|nr:GNAT family N-acetyltransferase [Spirochaetota bacterium]